MNDIIKEKNGKEKIHDIGFCMLKSGLRTSEILNQHPNYSCLSETIKSNNQLNEQPHCLSCHNAISTVKHNQIANKKFSANSIRHAYATKYFYDTLCVKNTLEHESINMTSKYIKK